MMQVRAKDKDGKEVKGWYCSLENNGPRHYIIVYGLYQLYTSDVLIRIPDISTAAVSTGKKDKHGKEIFGSKGEMKSGDRVQIVTKRKHRYRVYWDDNLLTWMYWRDCKLASWESSKLEIIKEPTEEKEVITCSH